MSDLLTKPILIPPCGHVAYVRHLGSDRAIVDAARTSYLAESKGDEADRRLLNYLYRSRHTSPFEQSSITFNIRLPIFAMRQLIRQRTFRFNEFSGRYSEMPDEFFLPAEWRVQNTDGNKQGSHAKETPDDKWQHRQSMRAHRAYVTAYAEYQAMLADGVAKEQARMVLPLGIYTQCVVNCDLHNLTNFLRQRLDEHAQPEIADIAKPMRDIAAELFPWTMEAFSRYNLEVRDNG